MTNSIFLKILKSYIVILIISISFLLFLKKEIKNYYIETLISKLKDLNYTISQIIKSTDTKNFSNLNFITKSLAEKLKIRITIINKDKVVLSDSEYDDFFTDKNFPELEEVFKKGIVTSIRYNPTIKEDVVYVSSLIEKENNSFILITSCHLKDLKTLIRKLVINILQFLFLVVLIVILIVFMVSHSITKPISQLTQVTKKVAEGNFDTKVSFSTKDEFEVLAENFNTMVSNIKNLIKEVSFQRDKIKNIFSSIQEAVVLLDKDGKIIFYNEKFRELCKVFPEGRNYLEVLISSEFNEIVKQAIKENKNLLKEINILDKIYLCSISFISDEELVVLLADITEHKQLQTLKKELVSNITHELKTPLAIIKGFAETIYSEIVNKEHKYYIEKIIFNTDRLIRIVNDLTTLSQLEYKEFKLEIEDVDLEKLVNTIKEIFEQSIKDKGLEFKIELQRNLKTIKADNFRLQQVLINLVENSLRYTDKGYIKILVEQDLKNTYIEVEDTGIGIPKEYHSRIFERFFVVDKSRSRQTGGTGLGLSIVKHIVELHRGEIFLYSEPNLGTKFRIILKNEL
ncbi:MAG: ATP-binding protein [Candidatus Omnitrophica bacterium]|nr:ATP-binding protein [Candidatus Omnitrophota bacterium]